MTRCNRCGIALGIEEQFEVYPTYLMVESTSVDVEIVCVDCLTDEDE